ncbi:hypothetical protein C1Y40_04818 [Mycobacterium talmoniae]|uniref:Uncharacterized protein n=1 Tax=Mycobacterium talmoniae TaxID=1858794 RepID=A0A2S8BEB5_9MYCO|nr:hypothetical protein C1Y40_04818 [Mycobacterium talmoniae]
MISSGTSCAASAADLPVSLISRSSISSRCSLSQTAKRANALARPLAPRCSHSRWALRSPAAIVGTSAGSVQCTCPASAPVAGLAMVPIPEKAASGVTSGVVAVIAAMLAPPCDADRPGLDRCQVRVGGTAPSGPCRHRVGAMPRR